MIKTPLFRGIATALITPFSGGEIDYFSLGRLIDFQLSEEIDALIIGGTTGEVSTLSALERERLYAFSVEYTNGRAPVILGGGSNNTRGAVELTKMAKKLGADGVLSVTPYYNKGTDEGLYLHYLSVLEAADIPVILYNVPSRTGVNLKWELLARLAEHENTAGIKEAGDSAERLSELSMLRESLPLYSGNDSSTYITLALGGMGTISVASNIIPRKMKNITECYFSGDVAGALNRQLSLLRFLKSLFCEVNPVPIKYLMGKCGLCTGEVRLPLTAPTAACGELIMREYNSLS